MNRSKVNIIKLSFLSLMIATLLLTLTATVGSNLIQAGEGEVVISTDSPRQGSMIKVSAPLEFSEGKVQFAQNNYSLQKVEEGVVALVPVSYWLEAGGYKLSFLDAQSNLVKEWSIDVRDGDFVASYLTLSQDNEKKLRPSDPERQRRQERERQLVYEARSKSSSNRLWEGSFIWPLEGRLTTGFGATRYHNGRLANRHNGIDIAAVEGSPVVAVNSGKVVLAQNLLGTGKTVIIDHGWNLFSSYLHHSQLKVEAGDKVERGEVIALVGSTGFSTGPHLHWSISIGRIFVDPEDFIDLDI